MIVCLLVRVADVGFLGVDFGGGCVFFGVWIIYSGGF